VVLGPVLECRMAVSNRLGLNPRRAKEQLS